MTATGHARAPRTPGPFQQLARTPDGAGSWACRPSPARIANYLLGGCHTYPADRQTARGVRAAAPWLETALLINRAHGHLTSAALAQEYGITQFLDLGSGLLPTGTASDELHGPVCASVPGARVVHVDSDMAMARYTRTCLGASPRSHLFVHADIRNIFSVLRSPAVQSLDPGKPVGVLAHGVLAWMSAAESRFVLDQVKIWAPPGSAISMTHITADFRAQEAAAAAQYLSDAGLVFCPRTHTEIAELLSPWALRDPGVVPVSRYHQGNPHARLPDHASGTYAAIALHIPGQPRSTSPQTGQLRGPAFGSAQMALPRGPSGSQAARPAADGRATKPEPEGRGAAAAPYAVLPRRQRAAQRPGRHRLATVLAGPDPVRTDQKSTPERTVVMCHHTPRCPTAGAPNREAARTTACHPEQGWSLLCNGVLLFEDTGEALPDGQIIAPNRAPFASRSA
jgi:hypothetical protein